MAWAETDPANKPPTTSIFRMATPVREGTRQRLISPAAWSGARKLTQPKLAKCSPPGDGEVGGIGDRTTVRRPRQTGWHRGEKTASPTGADFKGLRHLQEQPGRRFLRGILLHTGSASVAFEENLLALPVSALWQMASESMRDQPFPARHSEPAS